MYLRCNKKDTLGKHFLAYLQQTCSSKTIFALSIIQMHSITSILLNWLTLLYDYYDFCRLYYAKIGIGTPSKDYYVQVDTGSDIMWVNCKECKECPTRSSLGV